MREFKIEVIGKHWSKRAPRNEYEREHPIEVQVSLHQKINFTAEEAMRLGHDLIQAAQYVKACDGED